MARVILWCYLIWYLNTVVAEFDPSPRIWLNSLGISVLIGIALQLSLSSPSRDSWQTFRLFLMPFCVSSFSSLIKGKGYVLIFPTEPWKLILSITSCLSFIGLVWILRQLDQKVPVTP